MPTSAFQGWNLNKFTLQYAGSLASYEKPYREDYIRRSLNPFRFSIILAIFFYDIFAFLDAILLPELKTTFWIIRFGFVTPVLLAVLAFSFTPSFKRHMQPVISGIMYITGLGIIIMIILAARVANHYTYYAGLMLIFIFGYTFIRARFIYASIAGWSIVITYEIAAFLLLETPAETLINNNYFFISANVIGMFISYFMEASERRDFYMRVLLEEEQQKVQQANNALEKRVQERTRQLTFANKDLKKEIEIRKQQEKEKTKLESQLLQLQKMETIGTLAGGVAHDFNNILTPILGYTEMALEELSQESTLRYDIEQINNAALRGKDLVQQILTFSRQVDIDKKAIHLNDIVVEALNLSRASFPSRFTIRQELDPDCGTVLADASQMHQIVMNLLTNSYHAMAKAGNGQLTVRLYATELQPKVLKGKRTMKTANGTFVCLSVADTGHGMDKKTQERIFEPFFTSKEVGSGSGLGLSVVHGIVTNNGGYIEVESQVGKGTTFRIYLPQHSKGPLIARQGEKEIKPGQEHIMFVDDEKEITYMGKKMLESLGYKVDIHSDASVALEDIKKNPVKYDLLVTDQSMPKMLGTELVAEAKKYNTGLKCIIITGYNDAVPSDAIQDPDIDEILLKPLILSEFSKLIRDVLSKKPNVPT
ncbi:MAG: ATP-binding protein [Bacteroidales bacterium]|nr:ATP-binding protein [Bacteroidales bacterium]MDT8432325.1 ATP-binding protein [Bacteroidales bacterium]